MSGTRATPVSFSLDQTINKGKLDQLLSTRSYVDFDLNVLVLLPGGRAASSTVNAPERYCRILHIISYRYDPSSKWHALRLLTMVHRYEVYRHVAAAIQATKTVDTKLVTQKLARILRYYGDVRNAYIARARRGHVAEESWFSPELEYHLWLDYNQQAYHVGARAKLENELGVTFEYVLERRKPDILTFSTS